jgi:hypothetical protein
MLTITPDPWIGLLLVLEVFTLIIIIDSSRLISIYNERLKQEQTPSSGLLYLWRRRRYLAKLVGGVLSSTILLAGAVYQFSGGTIWPTEPVVRPHEAVNESSLVLGFTIVNRSEFFPMNNVSMTCGIDMVFFSDINGKNFGADSAAFYTGAISIPANSPYNYPCDASGLMQVRPDGSLTFRDTLSTAPTPIRGPIRILKMCVWVGMDYRIGITRWSFTSHIFKWPALQGVHQWVEGPTAVDQDRPKKMPTNDPDDLQCRDSVEGPYIYIKGFGAPLLLLDISKRTNALSTWRK